MKQFSIFRSAFSVALAAVFGVLFAASCAGAYDLLDYVKAPDNSFKWTISDQTSLPFGEKVAFNMTSQTWQGIQWKHRVDLFLPKDCDYPETAVLIVSGGMGESEIAWILTGATKCPVAVLSSIPNQPLYNNLREDALIAYTFAQTLETGDKTWPLLLPMAKSAVRAMDMLQTYSGQVLKTRYTGFVVGGASKRGWTSWLTAAADPARVKGVIPIVYDNLDLIRQMDLQKAAYGDYSNEISEYTEMQLQEKLKTKEGAELGRIVDPWTYIDRITMPKLIINGANDPYWNLASMNIYWGALKGEKSVMYVPNGGHDLGLASTGISGAVPIIGTMSAFIRNVAASKQFAPMNWKYSCTRGKAALRITTDPNNASAKMWVARSDTRDFRKSKWSSVDMKPEKKAFVASESLPKFGYMALFGEVKFGGETPYSLSTQTAVFDAAGVVPVSRPGK